MKTNGTWWTLGAVGVLAAVGAVRNRGSAARRGVLQRPAAWTPSVDAVVVSAQEVRSGALGANPYEGTFGDARRGLAMAGDLDDYVWYRTTVDADDVRLVYRGSPDPRDIERYAQRMRQGETPPPIVLLSTVDDWSQEGWRSRYGHPTLLILDGAHRVEAAYRADVSTLAAWIGVEKGGAVGALAAVGAARKRGSGAHWKVGVARRGETGEWGDFFFDLDSSKFDSGAVKWDGSSVDFINEREAAAQHAVDLAQSGEEPPEGWQDFGGDAWDTYDAEEVEEVHIPSIRDLKDRP